MMYSKEEIEEALAMLRDMKENCIERPTNKYNDPLRDKKYKALNIAIGCMDFAKIMCFCRGN